MTSQLRKLLNSLLIVLLVTVSTSESFARAPSKKAKTAAPINWRKHFDAGYAALGRRDYITAKTEFLLAVAGAPREVAAQYYLGLAAAYANDYQTAQQAMSRVVVMTPIGSDYNKNALQFFKNSQRQIGILEPYPVAADGKLIRWDPRIMPIKVHVTQGLQLPPEFSGDALTMDKFASLQPFLSKAEFYKRLGQCPSYEPDWYAATLGGLQQWKWATAEGFLKYQLVATPQQADIIVFWCPTMANLSGRTYYSTGRGSKVVVQMCSKMSDMFPKWLKPTLISNTAAHEFGHAWGLAAHSPNIKDLMSPARETIVLHYSGGVGHMSAGVTANDCAVLRALYQIPADVYLTR